MKAQRLVFPARNTVCVESYDFEPTPGEHEVVFETMVSAISSGTELALFTNDQDVGHWKGEPYPAHPGYAAVGRLIAVGGGVKGWHEGDIVFAPVSHASHHRVDPRSTPMVRVPEHLAPEDAVYVRFCAVTMTTLRTTKARAGDGVVFFGLGVVGTMGAQVFQASGYEVVGVDPVATRRQQAEQCGLRWTLPPDENLPSALRERLGETPCRLVVETSGTSQAVLSATTLLDVGGEIVLVGLQWKRDNVGSLSELLQVVFTKYLHLRSGWEWEIPVMPTRFARGSVHQNLRHAMNLLARGEIRAAPLRSHLLPASEAATAYRGLRDDKATYRSVILNWNLRE